MDAIVTILKILGALGIFLFGMKVMSEGVQKFAGAKMRTALATATGNRFKGVLTGLFTTSLVQSSSATTVLVVSFVNVGLLTLIESIGVIMGANLGTTITAWIVKTWGAGAGEAPWRVGAQREGVAVGGAGGDLAGR